MSDKIFLDTNIVVYLYSKEKEKKQKCKSIISSAKEVIISTQVINEFSSVLRKKYNYEYIDIRKPIEQLLENLTVVIPRVETSFKALDIGKKYGYAYYDNLILATAIENNCAKVYSEDFQHDQIIENQLQIINPFKHRFSGEPLSS